MNFSTNPTILDILHVCNRMRDNEIEQWLAMSGLSEYDPDVCTRAIVKGLGEIRFGLYNDDHEPYCIGGVTEVRQNVWEVWMVSTDLAWEKHWRSVTKLSRRIIDDLLRSNRCHRIQHYSLVGRTTAEKWYVDGLGMEFQNIEKKHFADGRDATCYVKVKE